MPDSGASITPDGRIVRVERRPGSAGLFYATSPDLKGLVVSAPTLDALHGAIPGAIAEMYAACGVKVVVTMVDEDSQDKSRYWVSTPAEIALASHDA